jgi:hypothetical protein
MEMKYLRRKDLAKEGNAEVLGRGFHDTLKEDLGRSQPMGSF